MRDTVRLQLRASEVRQRLNELAAVDELGDAEREEIDTLTLELRDVETRYRAALAAEEPETREGDAGDPEARELRRLHAAASASEVLAAAARASVPTGATAELQAHYGLGAHMIPLRLVAEELASVTTPTGTATQQEETEMPVFPSPLGDASNTRRFIAGTGALSVPTTSEPTDGPDAVAESAAVADTTITIGGVTLAPKRIQISAEYTLEDAATFAGLEEDVRRVLREAVADGLDRQAARGTTGIFDVGADADDANEITYAAAVAHAYSRVDGRYATGLAEVGLLCGSETLAKLGSVFAATTGGDVSAADKLAMLLRDLRVSAHAPAAASDVQQGVFVLGSRRNAVQAIWEGQGIELLRDPYTASATGEVKLTAVVLADFAITRAAGYKRIGFKLA